MPSCWTDGFKFSKSNQPGDWVAELIEAIDSMSSPHRNKYGAPPVERYLKATLLHREALRLRKKSVADIAKDENLSPKYLEILWKSLNDEQPSFFLDLVWAAWKKAGPDDAAALAAEVHELISLTWSRARERNGRFEGNKFPILERQQLESHIFDSQSYVPPGGVKFNLLVKTIAGNAGRVRVILEEARFERDKEAPLTLADALNLPTNGKFPPPADGIPRLEAARLGRHPDGKSLDASSLVLEGSEVIQILVPKDLRGWKFIAHARLETVGEPDPIVLVEPRDDARRWIEFNSVWSASATSRHWAPGSETLRLLVVNKEKQIGEKAVAAAADQFRELFPPVVCYPGLIPSESAAVVLSYIRVDAPLSKLFLSEDEHKRLDRL